MSHPPCCRPLLPSPFSPQLPRSLSLADKLDDASKPCYDQQALMRRYELISEARVYMYIFVHSSII